MASADGNEDFVEIQFDENGDTIKAIVPVAFAAEIQQAEKSDPERYRFYKDHIIAQVGYNINSISQDKPEPEKAKVSATAKDTIHVWTEREERYLIQLRLDMDNTFNSNKSHDQLWGRIFLHMNNEGMNLTKIQIMNKWKNLKKKYKEILDENNKTGDSPTQWKNFEVFNSAYGNKASSRPICAVDSTMASNPINKPSTSGASSMVSKSTYSGKGTKRNTAHESETSKVDILNALAKQHKEKMARMEKILNVFKVLAGQEPEVEQSESGD